MPYYYRLGELPHKRHTQFRKSDGSLHHEELMGQEGFSSNQSLLYHLAPPTQVLSSELLESSAFSYEPPGALRHRLLRTQEAPTGGDVVSGRIPLMGNSEVRIYIARPDQPMDYFYRYDHLSNQHNLLVENLQILGTLMRTSVRLISCNQYNSN